MAVFALWSAPRARSTAFFRSMAERGDMTVLHEPFCNLRDYGETDAGDRTFDSALSLLTWLRDETQDMSLFVKDHPPTAYVREVLADRRFLAESRHAFLIRRPEEIAAYCAAVGLPFIPRALTWEPGERPEWRRSARWHADVSASSGFEQRGRVYPHTVENSPGLARIAARHRPFYERLYAQRLDVTPWDHTP
jgi:hypothetical protein